MHGRAWERHAMCESAFSLLWDTVTAFACMDIRKLRYPVRTSSPLTDMWPLVIANVFAIILLTWGIYERLSTRSVNAVVWVMVWIEFNETSPKAPRFVFEQTCSGTSCLGYDKCLRLAELVISFEIENKARVESAMFESKF